MKTFVVEFTFRMEVGADTESEAMEKANDRIADLDMSDWDDVSIYEDTDAETN